MRVDIPYDEDLEPMQIGQLVFQKRGVWAEVEGIGELRYDHMADEVRFMDSSKQDKALEDVLRSVMDVYIKAGMLRLQKLRDSASDQSSD